MFKLLMKGILIFNDSLMLLTNFSSYFTYFPMKPCPRNKLKLKRHSSLQGWVGWGVGWGRGRVGVGGRDGVGFAMDEHHQVVVVAVAASGQNAT